VNVRRTAVVAGLAGIGLIAGLVVGSGAANAAAPTPPYEPDPQGTGTISFYDASGNQITSGSITDSPIAAYAVASQTIVAGDSQAVLLGAQPNPSANTAGWNTDQLGSFTNYPLTTGPANIKTLSQTHPVETGAAGDFSVQNFIDEFPNGAPGGVGCAYAASAAGCTNTAYQKLYQLRVKTSHAGIQSNNYAVADILVSGSTWTQIYPAQLTATSTALTANPNPATQGASVALKATVSPAAAAGSVQFQDGGTNIGSPVPVSSGVANLSTTFSTTGTHHLTAVFSPTDTATYNGSTSSTVDEVINPPAAHTSTSLAVTQDGTAGDDVNLVATVSPAAAPGTVAFFDNGSSTAIPGTVTSNNGVYTLDLPTGLAAGGHSIVAKFSPTDVTQFEASQSAPQSFSLQPPASNTCAHTPDANDSRTNTCVDPQNVQVTVPAGSLVISTPYTSTNPLDLGTMQLQPNATELKASAPFKNIVVTDTRSGNLPYTVSALSTPLTDGKSNAGSTINAQNVGLTNINAVGSSGFAGVTTGTDNPAADPAVLPSDGGSKGLGGTTAHPVISTDHGIGTLTVDGLLTITAPTSTEPGLFTGTITFTVG
jgi:hypothetical protein